MNTTSTQQNSPTTSQRTTCVFSAVLGESHTRASGLKDLCQTLEHIFPVSRKVDGKHREELGSQPSLSKVFSEELDMAILVSGNPRRPLSTAEQQKLVDFIVNGGHFVVAATAGGFDGTNMNDVLSLFGISVKQDAVIRIALHKYFHPKEVSISDGIVSKMLSDKLKASAEHHTAGAGASHNPQMAVMSAAKHSLSVQLLFLEVPQLMNFMFRCIGIMTSLLMCPAEMDANPQALIKSGRADGAATNFVYPFGCTLQVTSPAVPLLTSGSVSYPKHACVVAVSEDMTVEAKRARGIPLHSASHVCQGRVLVLGSAQMLADNWLDKEENRALARYAMCDTAMHI
jgi:intraflagellar transport protein 52